MRQSKLLPVLTVAGALALPIPALAQPAPAHESIALQLNRAAVDGPTALLHELGTVLAADPTLAADPDSATRLARAAAASVPDFVGANMPVYRSIAEKIAAAAPADRRHAVRNAVDAELDRLAATDPRANPVMPVWEQGMIAPPAQTLSRGYRIGSFTLYPDISSGAFFDDNVYATRTDQKSDWIGAISPRLVLASNWQRNQLVAEAQGDFTGYNKFSRENTIDWHTSVEGRIDATRATQFLLGGQAMKQHEDRASPDAVDGLTPTIYHEYHGYAGAVHHFGSYTARFGTSIKSLTFQNVDSTHGEINNHDRNRDRYEVGGLVRYDRHSIFRPYVQAYGVFHNYQHQYDDFGYQRDSEGVVAGAGALWRLTPSLAGDVFVGADNRTYADARFGSYTTPRVNAYLRWDPVRSTATILYFERSLQETTLPGSPGYTYNILGGRVEHALTRRLTGIARAAVARASFVQSSRTDDEGDFSAGLRYALTPTVTVGGDYRYTVRTSTVSSVNFGRNQVFFRIDKAF